ncbi:MAG TPA: hypothetical protein VGH37_19595 [Candidatus Acidoferrum sp.]|jgi:hypothetical protein
MRYWWVNQNQTFRQEIAGGYLWSPKRNGNGGRNPFYEPVREVAFCACMPGERINSTARATPTKAIIAPKTLTLCPGLI